MSLSKAVLGVIPIKIWDASEQKELPAEATYLIETIEVKETGESIETDDEFHVKGYSKLASLTAVSPVLVDSGKTPETFVLSRNYPNPFNPSTTISYQLNKTGMVNLVIYDLLGRKVETLVNEVKTPGSYGVTWNAEGFASGVYFYKIELGGTEVLTGKMLLIK